MLSRLTSLTRALFGRRDFEDDMAEEMRFHIERYTDELVRTGLSPAEAARRARLEFGSVDNVKQDCREARGLRLFDELGRDVRYAVRSMRKSPGFMATALVTLALCLGANLTIFAVVDSVLLRPLPFPDADRLVGVFNTYPRAGVPDDGCSLTNYYERRGQLAAFTALAAYRDGTADVGESGSTEREQITRVSPDFFSTLGLGPAMGRAFTDAETTYQTDDVAVLTDAYWRQRLDSDPDVIGRRIRVDGTERTVVGVLPPEFRFLSSRARIYLPLSSNLDQRTVSDRHSGTARMIGRLDPGATLAEAQAQIDAHNAELEADDPAAGEMAEAGFRSIVVSLHADHVASIRPTLLIIQAGALLLLLIGAVNLVNLLLIRASGRMKDLAVRQAVGAGRRHVASGVLVETTVLTLVGGLLGLVVGAGGIRLVTVFGADQLPLGAHIAFDARVAVAALVGAVVMGIGIGAPIAWFNLRGDVAAALYSAPRGGTAGRGTLRLRHGFIVAQIALAFVLLAGAGLLGLSLERVMALSPGFRPENVATAQISLPAKDYPDEAAVLAFTERLTGELGRQPGVVASGVGTNLPFSGTSRKSAVTVKGHTLAPGESPQGYYAYSVTGDYFTALGFTLREGRFLEAADSRRADRDCVVDEDFARRYWPHGGAIGQRVFEGPEEGADTDAYTIVGVVGAVKQAGLTDDEAQGAIYYPYGHRSERNIYLATRTSMPTESFGPTLHDVVRKLNADLAVSDVRTMKGRIDDTLVARRAPVLLVGIFSGIALLLTAVGTYGVLSYAVAQRRREIAVRMALGARPDQIRRQFVSIAVRLLAAGTLLGVFGAWLSGRAMQTILFEVPTLPVAIFAATAGVLGVVALAACLLPSHRAARVSPMEALSDQ